MVVLFGADGWTGWLGGFLAYFAWFSGGCIAGDWLGWVFAAG